MILLFWPFMLASIVLSFIGIGKKKPFLLVVSCFLIVPLTLYLGATPAFKGWGLLLPFFYLGAAYALRKNVVWLATLLCLPVFGMIGWLGVLVVTQ